ncbi:MAG: hypothetical protein ACXABY_05010 [Candidatus Thorarchaeota archaeon]
MAEFMTFLSAWYNFIFILPLTIACLLFVVEIVFGGLSDFGIDLDGDMDIDIDFDLDVDADADFHFLAWLGVGKVPVSILLELALFFFGGTGLLTMAVANDILGWGAAIAFPFALVVSAVAMVVGTRTCGSFLAWMIPSHGTTSNPPQNFVGQVGMSMSRVESGFGQVRLEGTLLSARTNEGVIPRGTSVVLVNYVKDNNYFIVEPLQ